MTALPLCPYGQGGVPSPYPDRALVSLQPRLATIVQQINAIRPERLSYARIRIFGEWPLTCIHLCAKKRAAPGRNHSNFR